MACLHIALDDYGKGYSSLSYINKFVFNTIKIDKYFVNNFNKNIIKCTIDMANNLDINLIAEGIETEPQLRHLIELECKYGQGYLFSKPLDEFAAKEWLLKKINK